MGSFTAVPADPERPCRIALKDDEAEPIKDFQTAAPVGTGMAS